VRFVDQLQALKASTFKYISDEYPHYIGVISSISGIVGLAGRPRGY
jgi:hypothetical protein